MKVVKWQRYGEYITQLLTHLGEADSGDRGIECRGRGTAEPGTQGAQRTAPGRRVRLQCAPVYTAKVFTVIRALDAEGGAAAGPPAHRGLSALSALLFVPAVRDARHG